MTKIETIILLLFSINIFGQNLSECGIDNNLKLTQTESEFLNEYMNDLQRKGFDFTDKKILFITGSSGNAIGTKTEYFDEIKRWKENGHKIATWVVELSDDEKEKIKPMDFDAIITYWVKHLTERRIRIILDELKASR